jgi:hypothetical protein
MRHVEEARAQLLATPARPCPASATRHCRLPSEYERANGAGPGGAWRAAASATRGRPSRPGATWPRWRYGRGSRQSWLSHDGVP